MKGFLLILCLVLSMSCFALGSLFQPHEAEMHINNYALALTSQINIIGADSTECYSDFQNKVLNASSIAKEQTQICIQVAENQTQTYIAHGQDIINGLGNQIANISDEISSCSNYKELEEMLSCLSEWTTKLNEEMTIMNETIIQLQQNLTNADAEIQSTETTCISSAINSTQSETKEAYDELNECLLHGTSTAATTVATSDATTEDSSDGSTDAASDATTEASSDSSTDAASGTTTEASSDSSTDAASDTTTEKS